MVVSAELVSSCVGSAKRIHLVINIVVNGEDVIKNDGLLSSHRKSACGFCLDCAVLTKVTDFLLMRLLSTASCKYLRNSVFDFFLLFSQSFVGLIRIAGGTHNPKEHFAGGDIAKWTRLDEGECVCSNANVGPALVGVCVWCTLSNVIALYIFAMSLRCALSLCRQKSFDQIPHNPLLLVLRFAAGRRPKIGVDTPSGQNALSSEQREQRWTVSACSQRQTLP